VARAQIACRRDLGSTHPPSNAIRRCVDPGYGLGRGAQHRTNVGIALAIYGLFLMPVVMGLHFLLRALA
jgi:hypothetical protein